MVRHFVVWSLLTVTGFASAADLKPVDLKYRSYRNWSIELPAEQWFPMKDGIEVGDSGLKFAVEMLGNDLRFDTDGDGELDRTIKPLLDKKTHVSTTRVVLSGTNADGNKVRYAVRLRDDANGWEWAPGGAMTGTILSEGGPIPIRIVDQNGNGRYDVVLVIAMIVGASDYATYLSKTVLVDNRLHAIEFSGSAVSFGKYSGPTSTIDMTTSFDAKAVLLSAVIISDDRQHSFDVGSALGPIEIPAGAYVMESGRLGLGAQRVNMSGGKMKPVVLAPGESQSIDWGGPARSEFRFARRGNQIQFSANSIWYYGGAGEEYSGWRPIGKSPEFRIIDSATGVVLEVAILPGSC